jgi:hypothetical protein
MVVEAGVVAGYLIAWAVRKAQRVGGRLDAEADAVVDAGLDRLHEVVETKLAGHPVMAELVEEAAAEGKVSELTRQQVELAIAAAARKDKSFGQVMTDMVAALSETERSRGKTLIAGSGAVVFTGNVQVKAEGEGIAIGQVAGHVNVGRNAPDPLWPGRLGH